MMHYLIKFDHKNSVHSITFLDTLVYNDKNRQLQTTLHIRPTNSHNYLDYRSSHLKHLKDSLLYSQVIRLRRIFTINNKLKRQSDKLNQQLSVQGYSNMLIENQITKAISTLRQDTLKLKPKVKMIAFPS